MPRLISIINQLSVYFLLPERTRQRENNLTFLLKSLAVPNSLNPEQVQHFVGPDLGKISLHRLTTKGPS